MSEVMILKGNSLSDVDLREMREIFFETSSKKEFKDDHAREIFYWKYLGFYLDQNPELVWVAKKTRVLGYVVGVKESVNPDLLEIQPHLEIFQKYFKKYPAHLHINLHHEARGLGIGSDLVKAFEASLKSHKISGLHIMTGADSRNRSFYQRLGFNFEVTLNFHDNPILFMGKVLTEI